MNTTQTKGRHEMKFFGTSEETFVVTSTNRIWLVQSPDFYGALGPQELDSLPGNCKELSDLSCFDLDLAGVED